VMKNHPFRYHITTCIGFGGHCHKGDVTMGPSGL
jgi:hypothetical protein